MTVPLVLASTSPYRQALLQRLGLPFVTEPSAVEESPLNGEPPKALAERLSVCKAAAISDLYSNHLIIGSDQVAFVEGRVLNKPGSMEQAQEQLAFQSGKQVDFHTSVTLLDSGRGGYNTLTDTTKVRFRQLKEEEISAYLEREKPFDCAGSFKVEGLGITLFNSIETTDPTALEGLPLILLCRLLRRFGVKLL